MEKTRGLITLAEACELLRKHSVPGYTNRESARVRIVIDNSVPHQKIGKQYFVPAVEIHKLIGSLPVSDAVSEDQALIKFYQTDSTNDYLKATAQGLSRTVAHAKIIYDQFCEAQNDPRIRMALAEKQREKEHASFATRKCIHCGRTSKEAQFDNEAVVSAATGESRSSFVLDEEIRLREFVKHRCSECLFWRSTSPVDAMRAKLQFLAEAQNSPEIEIDLSTTANGEGSAKTANGSESATPGASAEEASPLPTTPR